MGVERSKEDTARVTLLRSYLKRVGLTLHHIQHSDPALFARAVELGLGQSGKSQLKEISRRSGVSPKALHAVRVVDGRVGKQLDQISAVNERLRNQLPRDIEKARKIVERDILKAAKSVENPEQRRKQSHIRDKIRLAGAKDERKRYCGMCLKVEIGKDETRCAGCASKNTQRAPV